MTSSSRSVTREQLTWELLLAGYGLDEIAQRFGYASQARTRSLIGAATTKRSIYSSVPSEDHALQLARLDRLQRAWWDAALGGDLNAALLVERIIEHRSQILGLVPTREDDLCDAIPPTDDDSEPDGS